MKMSKVFCVVLTCFCLLFSMTANDEAQAACSPPVKIAGDSYAPTSIQDAYDYASVDLGLSVFTLLLAGEIFNEDLILDGGTAVLDGGYDCSFTAKTSTSGILGTINISSGSLQFVTGTGDIEVVSTEQCDFDDDLDGFTSIGSCAGSADDCNDNNSAINPGTPEICGDGIDQDCNGLDENCSPTCDSNNILLCITSGDCTAAGGFWWSDNTCMGVAESETVISAGQRWMDRNLDATQVATSYDDPAAYGGLYQWGREADGHQLPGEGVLTTTTSSSDSPGHSDFIITGDPPYDWRIPQNDSLWQGLSGTNNPCPAGFRIPTDAEWEAEMASWSSLDPVGAFASPLKLVLGGYHCHYCGNYFDDGSIGYYWSSTVYGNDARHMQVGIYSTSTAYEHRAYGYSVRCIQD